jgi:hypothetical protein
VQRRILELVQPGGREPASTHDLARALFGAAPTPAQMSSVRRALRGLVTSGYLTRASDADQPRHRRGRGPLYTATGRRRPPGVQDPGPRPTASNPVHEMATWSDRYAERIHTALRVARDLPEGERLWLTAANERAGAATEAVTRFIELGRPGFDAELEALLTSEEE